MLSSGWISFPSQGSLGGRIVSVVLQLTQVGDTHQRILRFFLGGVLAATGMALIYISVLTALAIFSFVGCTPC